CRDADLGHPPAHPHGVAHLDRAVRRGDDDLRDRERGTLPAAAPRATLLLLLADPVPGAVRGVAAVSQPAGMGLLRRRDVRDGLVDVLVPGDGAGPRLAAGPRATFVGAPGIRRDRARVAGVGAAL